MNDTEAAIQLSSILLFIVIFLFFIERYFIQNKRFSFTENSKISLLSNISSKKVRWVYLSCLIPIFLAFIVPVLFNLYNIFDNIDSIELERLFSLTLNSITVSIISSFLILILAIFFLFSEKLSKSRIYYYVNQLHNQNFLFLN